MPCVATLEYSLNDKIKTSNISKVTNFYELSGSLEREWTLSLDYNNKTCPYKLALTELQPFEDWSLKCQMNNTCARNEVLL